MRRRLDQIVPLGNIAVGHRNAAVAEENVVHILKHLGSRHMERSLAYGLFQLLIGCMVGKHALIEGAHGVQLRGVLVSAVLEIHLSVGQRLLLLNLVDADVDSDDQNQADQHDERQGKRDAADQCIVKPPKFFHEHCFPPRKACPGGMHRRKDTREISKTPNKSIQRTPVAA